MAPHADPSDRLAATRQAVERDADELRGRWRRARADLATAWSSIAGLGQLAVSVVRRRDHDGAREGADTPRDRQASP